MWGRPLPELIYIHRQIYIDTQIDIDTEAVFLHVLVLIDTDLDR